MFTADFALFLTGVILATLLGLRALIQADDDHGRLAGAALVALAIVTVAWIVASR